MEAEAAPFIEHFQLKSVDGVYPPEAPFLAYSGPVQNKKITVITNGKDSVYGTGVDNVGTVPAAMATFLALQKLEDADLVINAGTCGGFKSKGVEIGDVVLTTTVAHHDRRIAIPDFTPYGVGNLESKFSSAAAKIAEEHNFKQGVCTTSNSLDHTEEDDKHMLANDATVKDMEAAAIAWSCALFDKPYMGIKVVTDIVDDDAPTAQVFLANLEAAAKSLQESLPKVIGSVLG